MNEDDLKSMEVDEIIDFIENNTTEFRHSGSRLFRIAYKKFEEKKDSEKMEEIRSEILAFDLSTHRFPEIRFSPSIEGTLESGKDYSYPDLEEHFSDKTISYYENRITETKNPILKARYCDIIWELKKEIIYAEYAIDTYLECSKIYLENNWDDELIDSIYRSLQLSISINNNEKIMYTSGILKSHLEKLKGIDDYSTIYDIIYFLIDYIKKKAAIIDLVLLVTFVDDGAAFYKGERNYHFQRLYLELSSKLKRIEKKDEEAKKHQLEIAFTYEEEAAWKRKFFDKGNLIAASIYEEALKKYIEIGNSEQKIEELKNLISECYEEAKNTEFTEYKTTAEIPKEAIEEYLERFDKLTIDQIFETIAIDKTLVPSYDSCMKRAEVAFTKFVFRSLLSREVIFDDIKIIAVNSKQEKITYDAIKEFQLQYYGINILFEEILNLLEKKHSDYFQQFINYLNKKGVIDSKRVKLLKKGLLHYKNNDYEISIHLLIFQLEGILRDIIKKLGIPTYKYKNNVMRYKLLYDIINILLEVEGFDQDFLKFTQIFLCDIRGDNLRNEVAHGILREDQFTRRNANLLILLIIKISAYQIVRDNQK